MNATVNVVLFKSKTLVDGSHPLMIRICKDRKRKYQGIGISLKAEYWDFDKNKPKTNCPNRLQIETVIANKLKEYQSTILDLKAENRDFTSI